ncbi:SDR family oxidoreductase [Actinomadura sp. SCN-SB]|uniref:SDR family oxidoreductase n=1 Tax=Actinomadura sp. SCN-SB TaxID=3373092 RepID=UPI00375019D1
MLEGKVAVVTGAGRGLGRAYARAMAAAGAAVVVNDIDADVADETVALIASAGGKAVAEPGAIGAAETADALVARAVEEFGRLDVMCANAGVLRDRTLRNTSDEDFDIVIRTHLRGTFQRADRGEPVPEAMRRRGLGTADDAAPAVVFLASDAAAGVTGQCLAAGGDRLALWSHPQEVAVAVRDGGWTPETVAAIFPSVFEPRLQDYKQAPPPGAATPPGTSTPEKKGAQ